MRRLVATGRFRGFAPPPRARVANKLRGKLRFPVSSHLLIGVLCASVISCDRETGHLPLSPNLISQAPSSDFDRETLTRIYEATSGDSWTNNSNWLSNKPLDEWYGVAADSDGRVGALHLPNNNLVGPLPAALAELDSLLVLDLNGNQLTGPIPSAFGSLSRLRDLLLQSNDLSGPLPASLGDLSALRFVVLRNNPALTGPLPATFRNLSLRVFLASFTALCVPSDLTSWFNSIPTRDFYRFCESNTADRAALIGVYNDMAGTEWIEQTNWLSENPISTWHGVTTNSEGRVTELTLNRNRLLGLLSPHLWSLTELTNLELYANEITGSIPPEIGQLTKLTNLELDGNSLSGRLHSEFFTLTKLTNIELERNNLSGRLPSHILQLKNLTHLELYQNQFSGPLPPELGQMTQLKHLRLDSNNFTGALPTELGNLTQLETLYLSRNRLTGKIPSSIANLSLLKELWLHENQFTHAPPALGELTQVETLYLAYNHLRGHIPPEWGGMTSLVKLDAGHNGLHGPIPAEFGRLAALEELYLYDNALSGSIPPELGNLERLRVLSLPYNNLDGPIPPELGRIGRSPANVSEVREASEMPDLSRPTYAGALNLRGISLSGNHLSGRLPPELGNIWSLEYMYLNDNPDLYGVVPESFTGLENLKAFGITGTELCLGLDAASLSLFAQMRNVQPRLCRREEHERLTLEEFFDDLNGFMWSAAATNWGTDAALNDWAGVQIDLLGRVSSLDLTGMNIRGALPPLLARLSGLRVLTLARNQLSGSIPSQLSTLTHLKRLDLSGNPNLAGPLPKEITELPLQLLSAADTDLCVAPQAVFTEWLARMDDVTIETCHSSPTLSLGIPSVLATQVVQTEENDVPLISGRDLWLRIFVTNAEENYFSPISITATVSVAGEPRWSASRPLATVSPPVPGSWSLADEGTVIKVPGEMVLPGMSVVIEAAAEGAPASSSVRYVLDELAVVRTRPLELTLVPLVESTGGEPAVILWAVENQERIAERMAQLFGRSNVHVTTRTPFVTDIPLGVSSGPSRVIATLQVAKLLDGDDTVWYGVGDSRYGYFRGQAVLNGSVSVGKPIIPEVAHELGHVFGLRHAPCGGAVWLDESFPYSGGEIGAWGYQPNTGTIGDPNVARDVMGYCYGRGWISDYNYKKLVRQFAEPEGRIANSRSSRGGAKDRDDGGQHRKAEAEGEQSLIVWGTVAAGEIRLRSPFVATVRGVGTAMDEEYLVEVRDAKGTLLAERTFQAHENKFGIKYFAVPVPTLGWASAIETVVVRGPEGEVTLGVDSAGTVTVVRGLQTGRIHAVLTDPPGSRLPEGLSLDEAGEGLEVITSSANGVVEWRRLLP
ncbi:hypothetical protein [Candidatus Palauibacter sp.]|uniref:hypothetical protein n=1 Tax=Candidatus Palauibacter sp. TaxID=3101350 RepID=UPI003B019663